VLALGVLSTIRPAGAQESLLSEPQLFRPEGVPPQAEPVYKIGPALIEDRRPDVGTWINDLDMQNDRARTPGPFPLPRPDRLQWGSGFPLDMPTPTVRFSCTGVRNPRWSDAYMHDGQRWVITERLKDQFLILDPEAFDIIPIETQLASGEAGPPHWMCDLVRFRDAFHRERSAPFGKVVVEISGRLMIDHPGPDKRYDTHCFDASKLEGALFWREVYKPFQFCRKQAREVLLAAGMTNLNFGHFGWVW
jgi:hypothetical protein